MKASRFGLLALLVFALALPVYLSDAARGWPAPVRVLLIVCVGGGGSLFVASLISAAVNAFLWRSHRRARR